MSVPVLVVDGVERVLSLSDRTRSLDTTLSNDKGYLIELTGEICCASSDGESFEGSWLNGMMHGFGMYTWSNDCEWKAKAGNVCIASFDWSCSGICKSVEKIKFARPDCEWEVQVMEPRHVLLE
ncbi:beta-1,3-galactosyltransferase 7-like [Olea europaea subsp. europaea]|uniref:Beta-1,3-galactosyltransferase 7-like n=1 Tax=Olea europaea subsp. europaea TaxID=158383 RepID=A0A8S0VNB6_OLEEU|nr:beta-1,3-galactosyltransferase 7-like [Olea europaea subsp. europaea]